MVFLFFNEKYEKQSIRSFWFFSKIEWILTSFPGCDISKTSLQFGYYRIGKSLNICKYTDIFIKVKFSVHLNFYLFNFFKIITLSNLFKLFLIFQHCMYWRNFLRPCESGRGLTNCVLSQLWGRQISRVSEINLYL